MPLTLLWRRKAAETKWRWPIPAKKQYSVREQFYQHLPWHSEVPKTNGTITITIPKIINLNFASDMLHFIWPWAWRKRNITGSGNKGFIAVMKPCETPSPIILWSQLSCCLGMDVSHGLMTTIKNLTVQQKLKVIICYPAKKLSTNWYLNRHWHKIIWHVYKELKSQAFSTNLYLYLSLKHV